MIKTAACSCANMAFMTGVHQLSDVYKMALYGADADLDEDTQRYTTTGECTGQGYTAGGIALTGYRAATVNKVACMTFLDPSWPKVSIKTGGALIYNSSRNGAALAVIRFDRVWVPQNGEFTPNFPAFTATTSIIRLGKV